MTLPEKRRGVVLTEDVMKIMNDPGITRKVRRILLRQLGMSEEIIEFLLPDEEVSSDY